MEPKFIVIGLVTLLVVFGGVVWFLNGGSGTTVQPTGNQNNIIPNPPPLPPESNSQTGTIMHAAIHTAKGDIALELYPDIAPKTVANFVAKAKAGYFNGLRFHRVEGWVVQGGDPLSHDPSKKQLWGTGGGTIETELSQKPFVVGALGVARGPDIKVSNDSQFFIVKKSSQFLNNQYTLFGQVVGGIDVVNKLAIGDVIGQITIQ